MLRRILHASGKLSAAAARCEGAGDRRRALAYAAMYALDSFAQATGAPRLASAPPPLTRDCCYESVLPESLPGPPRGTAIRLRRGDGQPTNPHGRPRCFPVRFRLEA